MWELWYFHTKDPLPFPPSKTDRPLDRRAVPRGQPLDLFKCYQSRKETNEFPPTVPLPFELDGLIDQKWSASSSIDTHNMCECVQGDLFGANSSMWGQATLPKRAGVGGPSLGVCVYRGFNPTTTRCLMQNLLVVGRLNTISGYPFPSAVTMRIQVVWLVLWCQSPPHTQQGSRN